MSHRPRKRFGQNFLQDQGIISRIVRQIASGMEKDNKDHLVEIGPGQGAITRQLLPLCNRLDLVELDRDLVELLEQSLSGEQLQIHQADALKFDFCALQEKTEGAASLHVVGNLPYNISTPLIFHLLEQAGCIGDMHFMLQKEVVDRLAASPGNKTYGRLSVVTQARCEVTALFDIPPQAFYPPPKVMSAFVQLKPRAKPLVDADHWQGFEQVVTAAFSHRRKTLRNNLRKLLDLDAANDMIDLGRRAETLTISEFAGLAKLLL